MTDEYDPLFPLATRPDENDTQPFTHGTDENNREYIPATWSPGGGPGGSPKVSGGYTKSKTNGPVSTRGLNRRDQRWTQPEATLIANFTARGIAELPSCVIAQGAKNRIEFRAPSGNNYDLDAT